MRPLAGVFGLALLLYPFLAYLLLDRVGLIAAGALFAALALLRLLTLRRVARPWRYLAAAGLVVFLAAVVHQHSATLLKLYPVAVNAALLGWCLYTLWQPPSAVERLMQLLRVPVSAAGVVYTRGVTACWCGYFAVNGALAGYTAVAAPTAVWAVYNGAVSYLAAAVLFAAEYLFRGVYRRRVRRRAQASGAV